MQGRTQVLMIASRDLDLTRDSVIVALNNLFFVKFLNLFQALKEILHNPRFMPFVFGFV